MKNKLVLIVCMCLMLVGCGKEPTEYELAKQNETSLTEEQRQYLEKNWYGEWQRYYIDTGQFDDQIHTIDEKLYDGKNPYVIKAVYEQYDSITYELFDLDTGKSQGEWEDSIEFEAGLEKMFTEWRDEQYGGMSRSILVREHNN